MTNNVTNEQKSDAVIYSDGEIELNISIDNETVQKFLIVQNNILRMIA